VLADGAPKAGTPSLPVAGFAPETELERSVAADPILQEGLAWGRPRSGHPEGTVGAHIADLLRTIDRLGESGRRREELRFIALVHDALKYRVQTWRPRTGENHHATRARRFADRYTDDERLLATIEQHDRPYNLWRKARRRGRRDDEAFDRMVARIPDLDLFLSFVELDGSTEGKAQEPIAWLKDELGRRGLLESGERQR
jgi:HD domain